MNKIKEKILELKAIKYLGEEQYNSIKEEFSATYEKLCTEVVGANDINCKEIIDYLKNIKNLVWLNTIFEFLGGAVCGASLFCMEMYSIRQTIISCAIGLGIVAIAGIRNYLTKKEFNEVQDDLVDYVYSNMSVYRKEDTEELEENRGNIDYNLVACKFACNELLD